MIHDAPPSSQTISTNKKRQTSSSARKLNDTTTTLASKRPSSISKQLKSVLRKENSSSRANQTLQLEDDYIEVGLLPPSNMTSIDQSNVSTHDVHNFSTIVRPLQDSEEDRSRENVLANEEQAAISGSFSIFDQKKDSLQVNNN